MITPRSGTAGTAGKRRWTPRVWWLAAAIVAIGVVGTATVLDGRTAAASTETTVAPTSTTDPDSVPSTTEAVPLVPVPTGCDAPELPYIVFIGTVAAVDYRTTRFQIRELRAGRTDPFAEDDMIDIRYGQDTQYLEVGETYLVGAGRDPALGILMSRVTPVVEDFGGDDVIGVSESDVDCEEPENAITTLYPDGTPIDGPVLQPIRGAWWPVLYSIGRPMLAAVGVIFALALLRNGSRAAARAVRAEDR